MNRKVSVAALLLTVLLLGCMQQKAWTAVTLEELALTSENVAAALVEPPLISLGSTDDMVAEGLIAKAAGQWREGNTGEALLAWARIVEERPGTVQALKALLRIAGYVVEKEGDLAGAVSIYESAVAERPDDHYVLVVARMWEAELFLALASLNKDEGIRRLEELADQCAGSVEQGLPWLRLSAYYLEQDDQSRNDQYYQRAITAHPNAWYIPYVALSRCEDLLERRARLYPDSWDALTELCIEELDRALSCVDLDTSSLLASKCLLLRGGIFREEEDWSRAQMSFELLATYDPFGEWGANGVLEAARCAAEMGDGRKTEVLLEELSRRLDEATWLQRRQLAVFRSQMERIRERAEEAAGR